MFKKSIRLLLGSIVDDDETNKIEGGGKWVSIRVKLASTIMVIMRLCDLGLSDNVSTLVPVVTRLSTMAVMRQLSNQYITQCKTTKKNRERS